MPLPQQPVSRWLRIEAFVERMFIMFALYTFSIGPMYWFWVDAHMGSGFRLLAIFYLPLQLLGESFPLFGDWLNWYVRWWILG